MMTTLPPSPGYLEISSVLREICQQLQLNPDRHRKADERYSGVAEWLNEGQSSLKALQGEIFPQGSFRIGTTVRPFSLDDTKTEYDLDFVCLFQATKAQVGDPVDFLNRLQKRLAENPHYRELIEPNKRRCVRLNYADDFHMDILPAIPDPDKPNSNCLLVPDREVKDWKPSNPVGYADWFFERSRTISGKRELFDIESLPELQSLEEKSPLQVAVQLLKRRRDLVFLPDQEAFLPVSIVLTTLAGRHYSGQSNPLDAISSILQGIAREIKFSPEPIEVRNPANTTELLSEKWNDPEVYTAFCHWITIFSHEIEALRNQRFPDLSRELMRLFGARVTKEALESLGKRMNSDRKGGKLGVSMAGVITQATTLTTPPTPPNTFYGD